MAQPKMIYQRTGGPLIHWDRGRAPGWASGSGRAGDARTLGSYERGPTAGGPEMIGDSAMDTLSSAKDAIHSSTGRGIAAAASAFHGLKRTGSIGMALLYAAAGYVAPVLTPVITVAQGFAQKKGS